MCLAVNRQLSSRDCEERHQSFDPLQNSGHAFEILLPCLGTFHELGGEATVLLVEDEDAVRCLMHKFLERGGYQILEARNGEDAITLVITRWRTKVCGRMG